MKVLLSGFSSPEHLAVSQGLLSKNIEVCYWIIHKPEVQSFKAKVGIDTVVFHSSFSAARAEPAEGIDINTLPYPDDHVFQSMQKREMQIMQMMSQLDFSDIKFIEQKHLYFSYIRYWYGILKAYSPDAILFVDIPHFSYNVVLYTIAKFLGIKTIMFKRTKGLPDTVLFFDDFENNKKLLEEYQKQLRVCPDFSDLSESHQQFFQRQNNPEQEEKLKYSKELYTYIPDKIRATKIIPQATRILKHLKSTKFFRSAYSYLWMVFHKTQVLGLKENLVPYWRVKREKQKHIKASKKYRLEYESLVQPFDKDKKYVYVPLHLQPEGTTNPLGGIFDDQILMIEMLSHSLPKDWVIYVKENPLQWYYDRGYFGRYQGYYSVLARLPNVRLVPLDVSTFTLITHSQAVATITGTAGWEAIIRQKPVLIFGFPWYQDCEGGYRIKNIEDCRQAFQKIQQGIIPDKKKIFAFLKAVENVGVRGYANIKLARVTTVSSQENITNFIEAFYSELTQ